MLNIINDIKLATRDNKHLYIKRKEIFWAKRNPIMISNNEIFIPSLRIISTEKDIREYYGNVFDHLEIEGDKFIDVVIRNAFTAKNNRSNEIQKLYYLISENEYIVEDRNTYRDNWHKIRAYLDYISALKCIENYKKDEGIRGYEKN